MGLRRTGWPSANVSEERGRTRRESSCVVADAAPVTSTQAGPDQLSASILLCRAFCNQEVAPKL